MAAPRSAVARQEAAAAEARPTAAPALHSSYSSRTSAGLEEQEARSRRAGPYPIHIRPDGQFISIYSKFKTSRNYDCSIEASVVVYIIHSLIQLDWKLKLESKFTDSSDDTNTQ